MILLPGSHNVVFATLDSCRFDTAQGANLSFLSDISRLRRCETSGTYTLPAHASFFSGILPVPVDGGTELLPGVTQIWRSRNAPPSPRGVGMVFDETTIMQFYENRGYNVVGAGGVSFFKNMPNNLLPSLFTRFLHFPAASNSDDRRFPRTPGDFPLANIEIIVSSIPTEKPFFLFVNCPETHVPYDFPGCIVNEAYGRCIEKMYRLSRIKDDRIGPHNGMTGDERNLIKRAQVQALEWVDKQLSDLCSRLPENGLPTLMIVVADHGEELGEGGRYGHGHVHESILTVPLWCGIS